MSDRGQASPNPLPAVVTLVVTFTVFFLMLDVLTELTQTGASNNSSATNETALVAAGEDMAGGLAAGVELVGTFVGAVLSLVAIVLGAMLVHALYRSRKQYPTVTVGRYTRVERVRETIPACFYCDAETCEGINTTYYEETVLFGIVLYTHDRGGQADCVDCFAAKMPQTAALDMDSLDPPDAPEVPADG